MTEYNDRNDFPLLQNNQTIYLDNAATAQKPAIVIEAEKKFYEESNANPLRGFYPLSLAATKAYEDARKTVQNFIHADSEKEIIFTRNTTESLNLIAYSYALSHLKAGDEIVVSIMEHHSNMLPWQMVAKMTGAVIRYLEFPKYTEKAFGKKDFDVNVLKKKISGKKDFDENVLVEKTSGEKDFAENDEYFSDEILQECINEKTKLVAVCQVSNVLGCVNPIQKMAKLAHAAGAVIVVDAAQSAPHMPIDVKELNVDFLAFSGHKLLGPMGIGVLYGKQELLEEMPPFMTGGEMIQSVTTEGAVFAELPHKFEAGTVNAAGAAGLAAAIEYIQKTGFDRIQQKELELTKRAMDGLASLPHVHVIGSDNPENHTGIVTFTIDDVHSHDVSEIMAADGIDIRAGHHCAQPLLAYLGVYNAARASFMFYNTPEEVDAFVNSVASVRRRMGYGE